MFLPAENIHLSSVFSPCLSCSLPTLTSLPVCFSPLPAVTYLSVSVVRPQFGRLVALDSSEQFLDAVDQEHKDVTVIVHLYDEVSVSVTGRRRRYVIVVVRLSDDAGKRVTWCKAVPSIYTYNDILNTYRGYSCRGDNVDD